jgi:acyl-CoA thioesterase-1
VRQLLSIAARIIWLSAALLIASFELALSEQLTATPAETCLAANRDLSLGALLPRTSARLKSSERLLIVTIGSSSTVGLWVLRSAATYPEVMREELVRLRSKAEIKVVNSGRVGDTIDDSVARFQRDVFSHSPDLVVWQLGTNDIAWGGHADSQGPAIRADGSCFSLLCENGSHHFRGGAAGENRIVLAVCTDA